MRLYRIGGGGTLNIDTIDLNGPNVYKRRSSPIIKPPLGLPSLIRAYTINFYLIN